MHLSRACVLAAAVALGGCSRQPSAVEPGSAAVLGTFTNVTMLRRVIDGGMTSGTDVLVVYADRRVELRDASVTGPVFRTGTAPPSAFSALESALARSEWQGLPPEKGGVVPDGPVHVIEVRHTKVTRHANPDDEPVVREATAAFQAIWKSLDP